MGTAGSTADPDAPGTGVASALTQLLAAKGVAVYRGGDHTSSFAYGVGADLLALERSGGGGPASQAATTGSRVVVTDLAGCQLP